MRGVIEVVEMGTLAFPFERKGNEDGFCAWKCFIWLYRIGFGIEDELYRALSAGGGCCGVGDAFSV